MLHNPADTGNKLCHRLGPGMDFFQIKHTVPEPISLDLHNQVDGVEIFLTPEATGQVGCGIYGGLKFMAHRAQKTENTVADL